MSKGTVDHIITRIEAAEPSSPIAVFRHEEEDKLNAVFASTVKTRGMIDAQHPDLIGVYHRRMDLKQIRRELNAEKTRLPR